MRLTKIYINFGETIPHPFEQYRSIRTDVGIEAEVEEGEDPRQVEDELRKLTQQANMRSRSASIVGTAQKEIELHPEDYVLTCGQWEGKQIKDCPSVELKTWATKHTDKIAMEDLRQLEHYFKILTVYEKAGVQRDLFFKDK